MKWRCCKPVTTQSRMLVVNDDGDEGYADVSWTRFGPRLYGAVYDVVREEEYGPERKVVVDENPTF